MILIWGVNKLTRRNLRLEVGDGGLQRCGERVLGGDKGVDGGRHAPLALLPPALLEDCVL